MAHGSAGESEKLPATLAQSPVQISLVGSGSVDSKETVSTRPRTINGAESST